MAKREMKSHSRGGRVSRVKARAVAKSLKTRLTLSKKATSKTVTAKQTASGKGLITFRAEKILRNASSHFVPKD
jgi:hypothetical protein